MEKEKGHHIETDLRLFETVFCYMGKHSNQELTKLFSSVMKNLERNKKIISARVSHEHSNGRKIPVLKLWFPIHKLDKSTLSNLSSACH